MARSLLPFVQNGYYASRNWIPLVKGNGFTTSGGGEQEEVWETASGPIVTFDAVPAPLRQLEVAFSPVQEGSGDPSPDNVRPISGWDSLTVEQRGKNLFDAEHPEKNGYYNVGGEYNSATGYSCYLIPAKAEQKYTCQGDFAGIKTFWDKDLNFISGINQGSGATKTFTTPAGTAFFRISIAKISIDGTQQIEFGETASEVVPYVTGRSISITLGQTVYSGTVDVVTGVGEVDKAAIDMGTLSWAYSGEAQNHRFSAPMPSDYKYPASAIDRANMICSSYAPNPAVVANSNALGISGYQNSNNIFVRDLAYSDADTFKAAVTGQTLVYELATPLTIQLTPQEVESLAGDNVVWSTANGDLTVEYRAQ